MGDAVKPEVMETFERRYRVKPTEVTRQIERDVIGGDWGANGYTTMAQADRLGHEVSLGRGSLLLDLGAGRGWPGLYLAASTGCGVVMADVPADALRLALDRAGAEGLADRAVAVRCSATGLPLRPRSFDAVVHADVL
jgi:cyclopropane fatty-acyl-phospholipid synthase-like methyltransferase